MNRFQDFLDELAEALQFSSLGPDKWGACLIVMKEEEASLLFEFDDKLVPNTILLSSAIASLPFENRREIFEVCLKGNNKIDETLSCKPDEDVLYLHRRLHPDIRSQELLSLIRIFLEQIKIWRKKMYEMSINPPKPDRYPLPSEPFQIPPFKT